MKPIYIIGIVACILGIYLISLVLLALSVGYFTSYWKKGLAQQAPKEPLVYVALGDSAAQGVGATSANKGYVGQFAQRLEQKHQRPVRIINLSESGARIQDVINDQLPELKKYQADVVTLDIGGNDIAGFDRNKFESDFAELVALLPKGTIAADVPFFGGRTQLPLFGSGQAEKDVLVANQIIISLAKDKPITVVPLHQATKQQIGRRVWYYAPDYFHPNNLGYDIWTHTFWQSYLESK